MARYMVRGRRNLLIRPRQLQYLHVSLLTHWKAMAAEGELASKVAVVTGATQGMGAAIARRLATAGADVVINGRSAKKGAAVLASLEKSGARAALVLADLSEVEACRGVIQTALDKFGGVDILVNSAALSARATLEEFTPELFDEVFRVNVRAPLLLAQAALPSLRERTGVIINIGSVNGLMGWPNLLVYSASKGALITLSKNLGNALKYDRVRVFCLNVGWTDTDGERATMKQLGLPDDILEKEGKRLPIGRLMKPEEIAEFCAFLASPRAATFSGAVIDLEQYPMGSPHDVAAASDPQS